MLGNRVTDLEARLATQGKLLAEREYENNQLRQTNTRTRRAHHDGSAQRDRDADGRRQIGGRSRKCAARRPRSRSSFASPATSAQNCSATSTRSSSRPKAPGQTERMENALLRERINDIAAEVAKLADPARGPEFGDRGHAGGGTGRAESAGQTRQRRHRDRPQAPRKAAARSPNASAPCSRTLPAPASKGRNSGLLLP